MAYARVHFEEERTPPADVTDLTPTDYKCSWRGVGAWETDFYYGNYPGGPIWRLIDVFLYHWTYVDRTRNLGPETCKTRGTRFGNPINAASGNKFQAETDIAPVSSPLQFSRSYNSQSDQPDFGLGPKWTHTYARRIEFSETAYGGDVAFVDRPDGGKIAFMLQAGNLWTPDPGSNATLSRTKDLNGNYDGWVFSAEASDESELYDTAGRLIAIEPESGLGGVVLLYGSGASGSDPQFLPIQVTATNGRSIRLTYDSSSRLIGVTDPTGQTYEYGYDGTGRLASVSHPGATQSTLYSYGEAGYVADSSFSLLLTGITDEQGNRYASFTYDSQGRATVTEHANGVDKYVVSYGGSRSANVLLPSGGTKYLSFATAYGFAKIGHSSDACPTCGGEQYSYDSNGNLDVVTDIDGIVTDHDQDICGRDLQLVEAKNTLQQRTTQTTWRTIGRSPLERKVFDAAGALVSQRTWSYNLGGQETTVSSIDPVTSAARTTAKTYCSQVDIDSSVCPLLGLLIKVDGPRSDANDIVSYSYYMTDDPTCASFPTTCPHRKGDLWKATNALGQVTEFLAYDGSGRLLSVKDPNGVVTDMAYTARGWVAARKVRGTNNATETDDAIMRIDYWPTGLVKQVTQPDGSYVSYSYDAAHRLTNIADNAGNTIRYTLNNSGNRTVEDTKDVSGTLTRTLSRIYNALGQLQSQRDAALHATTFSYDPSGDTNLVVDAASHVTDNDHDPLHRLTRTLQDAGGIAASTQFQYDARDNLTQVIDPNGLVTGYGYDGMGNLTSLTSPDTGTATYTYDGAGNRKTQTDARNKVTNYSYDLLNRLATQTYGTTSLNVTSTYDAVNAVCGTGETFAVGRLTKLTMGNGNSTQYCYDRFGNPVRKVETINGKSFTLRYAYNLAGRLSSLTYPDGNVVDYARDAMGQVAEIGITPPGSARQVLLTNGTYYPFGPIAQWTFGNGRTLQRTLDLDYRPWTVADPGSGGLSLGYTFDAVGNFVELRDAGQSGPPVVTFGYDALNRLTDFRDGPSGATIEHYAYDATGNRTLFQNSSGSQSYVYNTGTDRLNHAGSINRWYDASGNTVSIGGTAREYTYTSANRMDSAKQNGAVVMNYRYNGKGEQVHRFLTTTGTNQAYTVYDEAGHWIGDYDSTGAALQQAIWLDDLPVGVMVGATTNQKLHYIEADALGTPRVVIDPLRNVAVWNWDLKDEAFGNSPPSQDPDLDGNAFVLNMRYPGQRYDAASGLNYNYWRDGYEAGTGRYTQSDPLGLMAGVSTYGYVGGSPLVWTDMFGLLRWSTNPVQWSPTLAPGLQTRTFPGDGLSTVTGSSLARTTLDWSISPACTCSSGGFSLNEYTVSFTPTVFLRQSYSSPSERRDTRRAEMDHVRDFGGWIGGARNAAQALEDSMKGQSFSSTADCEMQTRQAMQQLLELGARQTAIDSHNRWDVSGRHTEVIPGP
ncbi:DUF6531 domain-containing protein [Cognatiluteimonas profundi]|uniref:DUF6531 domain-containing protein n=1 Tax=Cognatiluteimonas profundi TaxID=2594501 RepID=UPI00131A6D3B|nr:DUF6531 domain-containing protein [Lysobacter profundi]